MNLEFTAAAMEDYQYWKSRQPNKAAKIKAMLEVTSKNHLFLDPGAGRVWQVIL